MEQDRPSKLVHRLTANVWVAVALSAACWAWLAISKLGHSDVAFIGLLISAFIAGLLSLVLIVTLIRHKRQPSILALLGIVAAMAICGFIMWFMWALSQWN